MRIGQIPRATVAGCDFHRHALGEIFSQMRLYQFQNFIALLFRNETECQFRHRMAGNNSLCPLPLIAAADSIDLSGWTCPNTLDRVVASFAEKFGRAGLLANQFVTIDWKFAPRFTLPIFEWLDAIVESRDGHTTLAVVKCGEQLRERGDRIRNGPAEDAGMQIHFRTGDLDFESGHTAQPVAQGWRSTRDHS